MSDGRASTFEGSGALLRFLLRRERITLPCWLAGATFLFVFQSVGSQSIYSTPQDLENLRQTIGANTAVIAMSGPTELIETVGGEVVFEIYSFLSIVIALMSMFLVGRHTRTEEETGRAELIRSARVGRRAPVVAALSLAALANLAVGLLVFVTGVGTGLPAEGSLLLGAALALLGLAFAALTAVAVQVFQGVRAAYGIVALALGVASVLRAIGDIGDGTLSWLSPIGWGQRTFPYSDNLWWPLLLPLAATAVLTVAAFALLDRRDFDAGLIQARDGKAGASDALGSPVGLAWRLQRGSLVGWTAGAFLLAAAYGSVGNSMEDYVRDNPEVAEVFGGGDRIVDSYLGFTFLVSALLAAAYGVVSTMRLRGEETSGRAEPIFATKVDRLSWLTGNLTVPLAGSLLLLLAAGAGEGLSYGLTIDDPVGQMVRMLGVALVYVPATWLLVALTVLGLGWLPRVAAIVAWVGFAYCTFIAFFGDTANLPSWLQQASPFAHTPQVPFDAFAATPLIIIAAVVAAFMAGGYAGVRHRDLGY